MVTVAAVAALAATTSSVATPAEIRAAQAEAERVLADIQEIDRQLELAVEAYNSATLRLDEIQADIEPNKRHLEHRATVPTACPAHLGRAARRPLHRGRAVDARGDSRIGEPRRARSTGSTPRERISKRTSGSWSRSAARRPRCGCASGSSRRRGPSRSRSSRSAPSSASRSRPSSPSGRRCYSSIEDQIAQLEAEERERQAPLAAEERRRQQEEASASRPLPESAGVVVSELIGRLRAGGHRHRASERLGRRSSASRCSTSGVPYVWGGASPCGFDCSGLVVYVFAQLGMLGLPHYTGALWQLGVAVSRDQLAAGDLVFFNGLGHMGIYIGGGQFIHCAAHGRRRQDLRHEQRLLRLQLRRRPPAHLRRAAEERSPPAAQRDLNVRPNPSREVSSNTTTWGTGATLSP